MWGGRLFARDHPAKAWRKSERAGRRPMVRVRPIEPYPFRVWFCTSQLNVGSSNVEFDWLAEGEAPLYWGGQSWNVPKKTKIYNSRILWLCKR
jgi:hypothetical protein